MNRTEKNGLMIFMVGLIVLYCAEGNINKLWGTLPLVIGAVIFYYGDKYNG